MNSVTRRAVKMIALECARREPITEQHIAEAVRDRCSELTYLNNTVIHMVIQSLIATGELQLENGKLTAAATMAA